MLHIAGYVFHHIWRFHCLIIICIQMGSHYVKLFASELNRLTGKCVYSDVHIHIRFTLVQTHAIIMVVFYAVDYT